MVYRVQLSPTAMTDIGDAYAWFKARSSAAAVSWFYAIQQEIRSLEAMPTRHPVADESRDAGREIRVMFFGKKRGRYRILFTIVGAEMHVFHLRHGARDRMSKEDLENLDW